MTCGCSSRTICASCGSSARSVREPSMRVPYDWLAEWVRVPWEAPELGARLTMAGFELEALNPAAPAFSGVVVGEIVSTERHPQADKLTLCQVSGGRGQKPRQIVCGAANARAGLRSALAI